MARVGIDYGTTNTVVVVADRGRYPLVPHVTETSIGHVVRDVFPSFSVYDRETASCCFGAEAERCLTQPDAASRYVPLRSLKRHLRDYADGSRVAGDLIPGGLDMQDLLGRFAASVYVSVRRSSVVPAEEPLEAVLTWPANANGAQRHVTRGAFRNAGFRVLGTLNEPSAAAVELADRIVHGNRAEARQVKKTVAVFDLGGGTFDASVVRIDGPDYTVLGSAGIESLGGDDFDEVLAGLFAEKLKLEIGGLSAFHHTLLLMSACREKERLSDGAVRSLTLDPEEVGLSGAVCKVTVAAYEKRLAELITPAVEALAGVTAAVGGVDAIYLVGGSSRLPVVGKLVAKRFPKVQLITTDKPFTATAMGAAIHSSETLRIHDVLARHFGVIRLADNGSREFFSPIFKAGMRLPDEGMQPVTEEIRYVPRHNIGRLRFLECTAVDEAGLPSAGVREWSEILFPYDPAIAMRERLTPDRVKPRDDLDWTEAVERYACDSSGIITVRLARTGDGQSRTFEVNKA
jgi:molecular chaperone DnaK (HSP70)